MPKIPMSVADKERFIVTIKTKSKEELMELKDDIYFFASMEALSIQTPEDLMWKLNELDKILAKVVK
jgi:hypothetical protein